MTSQVSVFKSVAQDVTLTSGAVRALTGPLVPIRFAGSRSAAGGSFSSSVIDTVFNSDGSAQYVNMSAPAGYANGIVSMRDRVRGTTIGVRTLMFVNTAKFDVVIDGVTYRVDRTRPLWNNMTTVIGQDQWSTIIVAENLPLKWHTVELHLLADPGGAAQGMQFYGWASDHSAGNVQGTVRGMLTSATSLPSTATLIPTASGPAAQAIRLHNTDSVAHTVTILAPDASVFATVPLAATGTSGCDATVSFAATKNIGAYKWFADLAAKVNGYLELI